MPSHSSDIADFYTCHLFVPYCIHGKQTPNSRNTENRRLPVTDHRLPPRRCQPSLRMSSTLVCPVVGTINSTLPPSHPNVDLSKPNQTCPVVGAKAEHHKNLHHHPSISGSQPTTQSTGSANAQACPALKNVVSEAKSKQMDDDVCPVAGPVTTVLPPDHPSTQGKADEAACPVTKAKIGHHKSKVVAHPSLNAVSGACPVTGVKKT
ncbi:hypothetical protein F4861DRAFT_494163 [Xylaria intraflava]|nr:hypothetical protein F4861DRAFT_494163 [Xylaria intraflava]